ncbi:MAG: prepilin-type N-terminal cleavage/methylation domain-containing protein, partial [Chthoniobacterales bacterium]|nr:prepilin-type N-terminal cleavage/methylation domain-containing protein [Chthoniobacterales bacterium]
MTRYRLQKGGFSLVEVVVAMGIVSFSVLATVGLLSVANDTNRRSREET